MLIGGAGVTWWNLLLEHGWICFMCLAFFPCLVCNVMEGWKGILLCGFGVAAKMSAPPRMPPPPPPTPLSLPGNARDQRYHLLDPDSHFPSPNHLHHRRLSRWCMISVFLAAGCSNTASAFAMTTSSHENKPSKKLLGRPMQCFMVFYECHSACWSRKT